jgi:hypothetical protein
MTWAEESLTRSWRALSAPEADETWRFLRIASLGEVLAEAGCHFPGGRECLIVSFPASWPLSIRRFPEGKGFDVLRVGRDFRSDGRTGIAIVRRPEGALDIFSAVAFDLLRILESCSSNDPGSIVRIFLERVERWQEFMARGRGPLSPEARMGLMGELSMLVKLTETPLGPSALHCWQGPRHAAQDFQVGTGSIEVKSTQQAQGFNASIASIEQLDPDRDPAFLVAMRFKPDPGGKSLADLVSDLRSLFETAGIRGTFDALLMLLGYQDEHEAAYEQPFGVQSTRIMRLDDEVPRLLRRHLPRAIRSASYVLDLEAFQAPEIGMTAMLAQLGVANEHD